MSGKPPFKTKLIKVPFKRRDGSIGHQADYYTAVKGLGIFRTIRNPIQIPDQPLINKGPVGQEYVRLRQLLKST